MRPNFAHNIHILPRLQIAGRQKQNPGIRLTQGIFQFIGPVAGVDEKDRHAGQGAPKFDSQILRRIRGPDSGMFARGDPAGGKGFRHL